MSNNESMNSPAFDGMLMNIVQRNKGIEGFFDAVYGFLRRKTDFFANKGMEYNYLFILNL